MPVTKIYAEEGTYRNVRFAKFVRQVSIYEQGKRVPAFDVYTISTAEEGNLEVSIPVSKGRKVFKFRAPVELVEPYFEPVTSYAGEDDNRRAFVEYILKAEDMKVKVENNG